MKQFLLFVLLSGWVAHAELPLMYWQEGPFVNFGDYLSVKLVERIVHSSLRTYKKKTKNPEKKLLAIGSILYFANQGDVIWGSGLTPKRALLKDYTFTDLDVRAVRGPITRQFLMQNFQIECPEIYGDPALLFPYFFPEFKRKEFPSRDYIVIPHYTERDLLPKTDPHIIHPTDPWDEILEAILDSRFVIASSLHGLVVAEAYGIPARMLRISEREYFLKFRDYYLGTNRPNFQFATSIEMALEMGGEPPFQCDLKRLYEAFPFEFWPDTQFENPFRDFP
ncbi:MAG TPA: polysaccharide pyruvyl transferase family protein [Chlamydiales bacterium]|nr:polysaccharide pyruvyl transferase family protein [Chlamydiales bacterium]